MVRNVCSPVEINLQKGKAQENCKLCMHGAWFLQQLVKWIVNSAGEVRLIRHVLHVPFSQPSTWEGGGRNRRKPCNEYRKTKLSI